jgi:hypothetical protein
MMDGFETVLKLYALAILLAGVFLGWLLFG